MRKNLLQRIFSWVLVVCTIVGIFQMTEFSAHATNSSDVMLEIPTAKIQQCGNQHSSGNTSACRAYALTYCRIILDNKYHDWTEYRSGKTQSACAHSVAGYGELQSAYTLQDVLKTTYNNINLGRPVILAVHGSTSFHYVVAVGYKSDCNPNALSQDDFIVLDPWDGRTKSLYSVYSARSGKPGLKKIEDVKSENYGAYRYACATSGGAKVVNGGNISTVTPVTKLTFSNLTTPGNLTEGQSGHVNGYVYTTNSPICSITAEVYHENGQRELSTTSGGFSVSQYGPIKNSKIDTNLKFGSLPAGTYYIKYTAKAKDGTTATARTENFTITGKVDTTPVATKIIFDDLTTPNNLTEGQDGHIGGSIHSSNSPIRYITFNVYEKNGRLLVNGWTDEEIGDSQYTLKNSEIDTALKFDKFSAGTYYIKYAVVAEDGTTASVTTNTFTIAEKATQSDTDESEDRGGWGPWSDWTTTPVQATATRQVETRTVKVPDAKTQYRYGRYVSNGHDCWCATYLQKLGYGQGSLDYSEWTTTRYSTSGKDWSCGYCNGNHQHVDHTSSNGTNWWKEYKSPSGQSYYWEETQTVPAYETQYRYRDWISA